MAEQWHISIRGSRLGPLSSSALKRLAEAGELARSDLIWKDGLVDWVAASSVKGLFPVPKEPPPLPRLIEDIARLRAKNDVFSAIPKAMPAGLGKPLAGLHIQRLAVGISASLGAIATFLPWASVPVIGTIYGTAGPDGWISLCLFGPAVVLSVLGDRSTTLGNWQQYVASVPAGIAAGVGIYKYFDFSMKMRAAAKSVDDNPLAQAMALAVTNNVRLGFGIYLLILAGAAVVAAVFLLRRQSA